VDELIEQDGDFVLNDLSHKIDATLREVFGKNSTEFRIYSAGPLNGHSSSRNVPLLFTHRSFNISQALRGARSKLNTVVTLLRERVEDADASASGRALRAYQDLDLHAEIERAASKLYNDGHYSNAVEAAVKALNGLVRLRSGLELDGSPLMEKAFAPKLPILAFNALQNQSDNDEQKGFMMLFSGTVAGLRNPRAHSFINDDPERALEFIAFVSLLAKLLDEATRT
jgi:uncharacterized protein (TIGR02391 family)